MKYLQRTVESEIQAKLNASGAILIRGPKSCGKTETARRFAKSELQVDKDKQVKILMSINPEELLKGETPRLIDEWQIEPTLWNFVRHEVDDRKKKGQFILTGSANPNEDVNLHSGAGRFTICDMQTLSWQELGISSGKASIKQLLNGNTVDFEKTDMNLDEIIEHIIRGGWPSLIGVSAEESILVNRGYMELLTEVDMSRVSDIKRDPQKVRSVLKSLSRNVSTLADNTTISKDIKEKEDIYVSRPTVIEYLDTLQRLMILDEQPAFSTNIRSTIPMRKSSKRHLCDVSLAVASLGLNRNALKKDLPLLGYLFESLVYHELKAYAKANDASVFHYRDAKDKEVDAIVQTHAGKWLAFEVKLGAGMVDQAAKNLLDFSNSIDIKNNMPVSLNIITGTGMTYTRPDGVNVISLASLGV
ncbi:MAG: DUF4143 domain-containing protein [Bacteroidales bacterium]|jgi:predicted AAA+ superfamily ATPase|nr:DUF4143 domain-containing protein [Bacteroidales bacterium]